jgi:protein PhnA
LEKLIQPIINLPKIKNTMDENDELIVRDSNGAVLKDGDSVTVIKDLKVRGSSSVIKRGTMVKNIRLTDDADEVEGKVEKSMMVLRTEFLKKG